MIFCFSGTGNSRYAASRIGDSKIINIGQAFKNKEFSYTISDNGCTGCGMCARNCPSGLIETMENTLCEFSKLSRQSPRSRASTDFGSLLA